MESETFSDLTELRAYLMEADPGKPIVATRFRWRISVDNLVRGWNDQVKSINRLASQRSATNNRRMDALKELRSLQRELCLYLQNASSSIGTAEQIAEARGWKCFHEKEER
jgi:hypothetical protein